MVRCVCRLLRSRPCPPIFSMSPSSTAYREFLAERQEVLNHKWMLSEKAGRDVGFEKAMLDWARLHRQAWRRARGARKPEGAAA